MADAGALFERALRFHQQGRLQDAVAAYGEAIRADPNSVAAHNNLGAVLQSLGRHAQALAHFQRAVALLPDDPRGHLNVAGAAFRAERRGLAVDHLAAAYRLAPDALGTRERLVAALGQAVPTTRAPNVGPALDILAADPGVDLVRIAPAVLARVKADEPVRRALRGIERGGPPPGPVLGPKLCRALSQPAVLTLLSETVVADHEIETLLTALRAAWLSAVSDDRDAEPAPRELISTVALQACATEWVFDETAGEAERLGTLERRLDEPAARWGQGRPALALLVYALYRPLGRFASDRRLRQAAEQTGGSPVCELLRRHLLEPEEEAAIAARVPSLTEVADGVSRTVRAQYEDSPYPCWRRLPRRQARFLGTVLADALDDPEIARALDVPAPRILVAGCGTGRHALATATRFAGASVLAVDLSRASLAYGARQAEALGIDAVAFAEADILGLGALDERFDVIECSGVLHHMADPEAGWRVLRGLLEPGGLMRIALYSARGRAGIDAARALIAERGLEPTPAGIRAARALIRALPADAPARAFAATADFFSLSGCRDMLFHVHEDRFTLPRIAAALAALDLDFLGFELPDPRIGALFRARFPADSRCRDLANWDRLEADHPTLFAAMYQFWCRART